MPRRREFGISGVLLALVIVPLLTVVIVRKWKKNRAARRAEIRKLLILAAEEAARVEAEAAAEYASSSTTVKRYQCALCFSAATTRCSRCKAVRYCSGKCQIVHWRQGHKQECQPPDTDNSSTSVSCISSQRSEPDSGSLTETQELRSYEPDVQGPRNSIPSIQKLSDCISETRELFAPEIPHASTSKISHEIPTEIYDPEGVNVIDSAPVATQTSNVLPKVSDCSVKSPTACVASSKDDPIPDSPTCESCVADVPNSYSIYLSNSVSSDPFSSKDVADSPKFETPVSDIPFTNSVDNISCSNVSTSNAPILENGTVDPPVSSISSDNFPIHSSSENGICDPTSLIQDLPASRHQTHDLPGAANDPPISKEPVHNILVSKSHVYHSSSTNGHAADASTHLRQSISSNDHVVDVPMHKDYGKDTSSYGISLSNSSSAKSAVSNVSSCKSSLSIADGCSTSTCPEFQGPVANELATKISVPKIDSQKTSVSNGGSRRSVRTVFQHSSPQKERASVRTISRPKTGNCDTLSSNAFQTVGSSLYTANGFKASVKKVAQQLKSSKASKQNATRTINDSIGKSSKLLFPYENFVKLFNWDKLELPPCGLINCGNSCYANAVLQCLTFTRPIAAYLLQGYHSKICKTKDWCFMCELEYLVSRVREGKSPLSPIRIMSQIQNIGNHLGYGREEDAHEFLRFAIDTMQSICLDEAGGEKTVDPRAQETTFIQQIFGGYLQSKIKCLKCQHISEHYENMMDLTVEIEGNIESLQDALAQFTASEILDGENKYKCDRCKSYVKARKQLTVHEAPNILTIALKRFQTGKFGKLNKRVIFPEALNMKPYMSGMGDKPPLYKLYAVVVHLDMMNASFSGHYVCYVKNLQGVWYKIDDSKVKQVELDRVLSQGAYMLLYSRSSPRPPAMTKNGMAHTFTRTSTTVRMDPCTKGVKPPLLNSGHKKFGMFDTRWSPVSCTVNLGEYADWTSSDSGSLFSCSDEASCSTESNRDSTSTDDYSETVFGDSVPLTYNSSVLPEDSYGSSNLTFCMQPSAFHRQTEYCFENDAYCLDSIFSNQLHCDNVRHVNGKIDQRSPAESYPPPPDIAGLPAWLSDSAGSCFLHPSVHSNLIGTHSDTDLCSRRSDWLDYRIGNVNENENLLQSQNLFGAPHVSDGGAYSRSEYFAAAAKSQYDREKYMPAILKESGRINFDVPSRSFNAATNFDYSLVHDDRSSGLE